MTGVGSVSPVPSAPATGDITELQNECNVQGFSSQEVMGLVVDGIVGPKTCGNLLITKMLANA